MNTRINKFVAQATALSRRKADQLISEGLVFINGRTASLGDSVGQDDQVILYGRVLKIPAAQTIMLNKPVGYVCSRQGQGSRTIYELLPDKYAALKPVGRLDKDSSGLLLLTNDGRLNLSLTHPRYIKEKIYKITLDKPLMPGDLKQVSLKGVMLSDGLSKFKLSQLKNDTWIITMHEGRNRQIRRTFEALGYKVTKLHRLQIGPYKLGTLPIGKFKEV